MKSPRPVLLSLSVHAALAVAVIGMATAAMPAAAMSLAERTAAASKTAENNPACQAIRPFYWAVGNAKGRQAGQSVGAGAPSVDTKMAIASASKMIYGTWVAEQRGGVLTKEDASYLNFTSGYTQFDRCLRGQTVAECQSYHGKHIDNGGYVRFNDGKFYYSGGHMEKHATLMGLGPDDNEALAAHINAGLGGMHFAYTQPQLAGGVKTDANEYGQLLQRIVGGQLKMRDLLGANAVCTNPETCPTARAAPMPTDESLHYAVGHWVEDDPAVGDGAFSSAGAFGFYPWIDAGKKWWGVVARESYDGVGDPDGHKHPGIMSMYCGRQIRAAWVSGQPR